MGHLQDFERELRSRIEAIEPGVESDQLIHWLKEEVLKSYRNGLASSETAAGQRARKGTEARATRHSANAPRKDNGRA